MYYEERVINGVLHCRGTPDGEWRPVTLETLTSRLIVAETTIRNHRCPTYCHYHDPFAGDDGVGHGIPLPFPGKL